MEGGTCVYVVGSYTNSGCHPVFNWFLCVLQLISAIVLVDRVCFCC
jgi:hypothetical protein